MKKYDHKLIKKVADICVATDHWAKERAVYWVLGNGGSASTASHFVGDLRKKMKYLAICPPDNISSTTAYTNDEGWENAYNWMTKNVQDNDMVFLISVNGGTGFSSNLVKMGKWAKHCGAFIVGLSGRGGGEFNKFCNINIVVKSDDTYEIESIHSEVCHELMRSIEASCKKV
jgi:D-sedoheptulose 7-phosphate isomerase